MRTTYFIAATENFLFESVQLELILPRVGLEEVLELGRNCFVKISLVS